MPFAHRDSVGAAHRRWHAGPPVLATSFAVELIVRIDLRPLGILQVVQVACGVSLPCLPRLPPEPASARDGRLLSSSAASVIHRWTGHPTEASAAFTVARCMLDQVSALAKASATIHKQELRATILQLFLVSSGLPCRTCEQCSSVVRCPSHQHDVPSAHASAATLPHECGFY